MPGNGYSYFSIRPLMCEIKLILSGTELGLGFCCYDYLCLPLLLNPLYHFVFMVSWFSRWFFSVVLLPSAVVLPFEALSMLLLLLQLQN